MISGPESLFGELCDRRQFLARSLGGAAILAIGSVLPAGCHPYPRPRVALRFLTAKEYAIINQAAARILAAPPELPVGPEGVDVAAAVDPFLAAADRDLRGQVRLLLRVFEHGTYLFDLRRRRFTRLAPHEQDRYLEGWMRSTLGARRLAFRALKALSALGYYADPRTWPALGYEGPWIGRVAVEAAPARREVPLPVGRVPLRFRG